MLRNKTKTENKDPFVAWNESLDVVMQLGRAYIDRISTEKFVEAISHADSASKSVLELLCSLFALSKMENDMGWYLSYNYFAPVKARAITEEINKICSEIRYVREVTFLNFN